MRKVLFAFLIYCAGTPVKAQRQDLNLYDYNTAFGAVTGGIGAVINKPKHENWKKSFVRGFWQGAIGGSLQYSGKKIVHLIDSREQPLYGWPAKLVHAAGTSIVHNAAIGGPFLKNWRIDYGPLLFDFSTKGDQKTRVRFLPFSIYSYIAAGRNSYFDWRNSLRTGDMVFRHKQELIRWGQADYAGMNYGRAFTYTRNSGQYFVMAHEIIHSFQFREYQVLNDWLRPANKWIKPGRVQKFVDRYIYPDIPYMWGFYMVEGYHSNDHYFRNFFEFEAQRFASNRYVEIR